MVLLAAPKNKRSQYTNKNISLVLFETCLRYGLTPNFIMILLGNYDSRYLETPNLSLAITTKT